MPSLVAMITPVAATESTISTAKAQVLSQVTSSNVFDLFRSKGIFIDVVGFLCQSVYVVGFLDMGSCWCVTELELVHVASTSPFLTLDWFNSAPPMRVSKMRC